MDGRDVNVCRRDLGYDSKAVLMLKHFPLFFPATTVLQHLIVVTLKMQMCL
jgi:hypothetical protein